jgi:hypothetical protein
MPRPNQGTGQTSGLRTSLAHPDPAVQADAVAKIAASYGETQDLTRTAQFFGCERRTLERAIQDFPLLRAAIGEIRNRLGIVGR